jgi:CBS domain-containing protein
VAASKFLEGRIDHRTGLPANFSERRKSLGRSPVTQLKCRPAAALTCRDIMTRDVITVPPELSLSELCRVLSRACISAAPVVDQRGRLLGVVSRNDVLRALSVGRGAPGLPSSSLHFLGLADTMSGLAEDSEEEAFGQVVDLMTSAVETVAPQTSLRDAARLMSGKRVHRLIVVDADRVVGTVTSLDLLEHFGA